VLNGYLKWHPIPGGYQGGYKKNSNNQATLVFPQVKNLTLIGQKIPVFRLLTLATEPTFLVG